MPRPVGRRAPSTTIASATTSTASTARRGHCAAIARRRRTWSRRRTCACSRRPRFLRKEGDLGYLLGALRNIFLDARRAAARRPPPDALPLDDLLADRRTSVEPEAAFAASEVYAAIAALPGRLPRRHRGRRRGRPLLPRGGEGARDEGGDGHEPPPPGPRADRGRAGLSAGLSARRTPGGACRGRRRGPRGSPPSRTARARAAEAVSSTSSQGARSVSVGDDRPRAGDRERGGRGDLAAAAAARSSQRSSPPRRPGRRGRGA